jgi:hypothetical protein
VHTGSCGREASGAHGHACERHCLRWEDDGAEMMVDVVSWKFEEWERLLRSR